MKIYYKRFLALILLAFLSVMAFCQENPVNQVGNVEGVEVEGQVVKITTEDGFHIRAIVYSPSVVRIRIADESLEDDFSYAVIAEPQETRVNITQTEEEIRIVTDSLVGRISKKPFAVAFYTPDGKLINRDEEGLTTSWIMEEPTTYKEMQEGERFIGLGEKTGGLDRRGNAYTNWNTDAFGYGIGQDPIYATIPFYIGIHSGLNYGIFFDNTYRTDFNFGASNDRFSSFGAQGGEMDYYFIYHKEVSDIIESYTALTGRMPLPPLWSLGYQQNRYSYYPETEVMRIAQTLREKRIPADGITLDIHYMDAYKLFTWNNERFPNPLQMNENLEEMGFKTTVIVDPGIKVEEGYAAYQSGKEADIFLKYPDGEYYTGQVWPGWTHFPDFTSERGRAWWREQVKKFANEGIDGLWNDMNEIATWGQAMPDNVLFEYDGHLTTHKKGRNVYGLEMTRASYEGAREAMGKRPFILTRAGFAGLQRYTALWTGDNRSEDDHMLLGVRLLNSLGVSGVPFTGMDVGGFTGNPSIGLYSRWIQLGAFFPYFRNHTGVNTKSSEPWAYGEEVTEIARNFISLRYKLLPYLYSTFYEATQNGMPIMRTLAIEYTHEPAVYSPDFQNQFLFGEAFLVAPFVSTTSFGRVYFPEGKWYDLYTGEVQKGGQDKILQLAYHKLPVFVKGSSIVPMQSLIQSTAETPTDTLRIHVYQGDHANAFVYYEDDGESYEYLDGQFFKRQISYNPQKKSITFNEVEGSFDSNFNYVKIVFHGFPEGAKFKFNGKKATFEEDFVSFIDPISRFDPQGVSNPVEGYGVKSLVVPNARNQFTITY